jgi:hypothetical protein
MINPNDALRAASGSVSSESKLVSFLYELIRDHMTPGQVEQLVRDSQEQPTVFTNGWIAYYAEYLANRLLDQTADLQRKVGQVDLGQHQVDMAKSMAITGSLFESLFKVYDFICLSKPLEAKEEMETLLSELGVYSSSEEECQGK